MRGVVTVREHEKLKIGPALTQEDVADLEAVARKVLKRWDGDLAASKYVGIITTRRGVVVEILPKIDLGACAVGIHGCKSALIRPFGRSISSNMTRYSPQSIDRRNGDSEFSLSRIPTAQAPSPVYSRSSILGVRTGRNEPSIA